MIRPHVKDRRDQLLAVLNAFDEDFIEALRSDQSERDEPQEREEL